MQLPGFGVFSPPLALSQHPPPSPGLCTGHVEGEAGARHVQDSQGTLAQVLNGLEGRGVKFKKFGRVGRGTISLMSFSTVWEYLPNGGVGEGGGGDSKGSVST